MLENNRASAFSFVWIIALIIAGLVATAVWEFYARGAVPVFFGDPARPPIGFEAIIANLIGQDLVSFLALHPDVLITNVAVELDLPITNDLANPIFAFAIADEQFTITQAVLVHLVGGVVGFPLLYMLIIRPIFFFLPSIILGPLYGGLMFVLAGYVLNTIVLGGPAFFGWGDLAIASLVGHVLYGFFLGAFASAIAGR